MAIHRYIYIYIYIYTWPYMCIAASGRHPPSQSRHESAQSVDSGRSWQLAIFLSAHFFLFLSLSTRRAHPEQPPPRRVHAKQAVDQDATQGPTKPPRQAAKAGRPERGGAQMSRLITRLSFCTRLSRKSPCLIVARYCALLASGRVLLTTPATWLG